MSDIIPHTDCLSDLLIDEAISGDLSIQAQGEIERHITECNRCRNRWNDIERERAAFLSNAPNFEALAEKVVRAEKQRAKNRTASWLTGLAAATAAVVLFVLARQPIQPIATEQTDRGAMINDNRATETRSKGSPHVGFYIKHGVTISEGRSGAVVYPGDQLRFTYSSDTPRYLALFNLDAKRISVYFPSDKQAKRVVAGLEVALDFSVELDETIGSERVFAVFCDTPFPIESVRQTLTNSRETTELPGCWIDTIQLTKEPTP